MRFFLMICAITTMCSAVLKQTAAEEIIFETDDGVFIAGSFFPAQSSPSPAVLLIHMLRKNRSSWTDFAGTVQKNGYAVLTVDLRGHGQSTQTKRGPISELAFSEKDYADIKYDVSAAVQWLRTRPEVIPTQIVLIGASIGVNVAINYAVYDSSIRAVVLVSPGAVYRGISLRPAFQAYIPRPVLVIAAEDDNYSAVTVRELFPLVADEKAAVLFKDGGHGTYLLRSRQELTPVILDFLKSNMR